MDPTETSKTPSRVEKLEKAIEALADLDPAEAPAAATAIADKLEAELETLAGGGDDDHREDD